MDAQSLLNAISEMPSIDREVKRVLIDLCQTLTKESNNGDWISYVVNMLRFTVETVREEDRGRLETFYANVRNAN